MRLLICGDRHWEDFHIITTTLHGFLSDAATNFDKLVIIEGCAKGADSIACHWYDGRDRRPRHELVKHEHYPADWETHGKPAGPIRNRQMLGVGKPDIVVAFHDDLDNSKGTKDMVDIAKAAKVPVYVIKHA